MNQGLIQIYTGDGKGKTTAAVGQVVRALGHNLRVCYISFLKDPAKWGYGEIGMMRKWGVDVYHFALQHPYFCKKGDSPRKRGQSTFLKVRQECLKALGFIAEIFKKDYDLLILDEINIILRDGFLKEDELLLLLQEKPKSLEIVLTGRGATPELIKIASLVTEMKKIKHPFDRGTKARKGIEY